MTIVRLPRLHWSPALAPGDPEPHHRALLVHGLGSSAATMWRIGEALAQSGWSATAVDLRGHGRAPRASRYRIEDLAADLGATMPENGEPAWDLVIGHSIGAAASVVAAADDAAWTRRLALLDPALTTDERQCTRVLEGQRAAHASATVESTRAENPSWHDLDVQQRVVAVREASLFALEHCVLDNPDWDTAPRIADLACPTLVIAADPTLSDYFAGDLAQSVLASNSLVEQVVIAGAGHSVHRDAPEQTLAALGEWLARV